MTPTPDVTPLLPDDQTLEARRQAVVAEVGKRHGRRHRSRWVAAAAAGVFVIGGGIAVAGGLFSSDDIAVDAGIACLDSASVNADMTIVGPDPDPVAACARLWSRGTISGHPQVPAPELVACAKEGQAIRVMPGRDATTCARLGWSPLPSDYSPEATRASRARAALSVVGEPPTSSPVCADPRELATHARRALTPDFADVTVRVSGTSRCAGGFTVDHGDIVLSTVSEEKARENRTSADIDAALEPMFDEPTAACRRPADAVSEAARLLARAGLDDVRVSVDGSGDCIDPGLTVDAADKQVRFTATDDETP